MEPITDLTSMGRTAKGLSDAVASSIKTATTQLITYIQVSSYIKLVVDDIKSHCDSLVQTGHNGVSTPVKDFSHQIHAVVIEMTNILNLVGETAQTTLSLLDETLGQLKVSARANKKRAAPGSAPLPKGKRAKIGRD